MDIEDVTIWSIVSIPYMVGDEKEYRDAIVHAINLRSIKCRVIRGDQSKLYKVNIDDVRGSLVENHLSQIGFKSFFKGEGVEVFTLEVPETNEHIKFHLSSKPNKFTGIELGFYNNNIHNIKYMHDFQRYFRLVYNRNLPFNPFKQMHDASNKLS